MRNKLLLLVAFALIGTSFITEKKPAATDHKGMVLVNRGTFLMGLDSAHLAGAMDRFKMPASYFSQESPAFRVTVPPFYIDKYEVTNAQYKKFIDANPRWSKQNIPDSLQNGDYLKDWNGDKYPQGKADYPVVYVCWYAANAYAYWIGKRLPTESEREYTARGTETGSPLFPWGDADADPTKANYIDSGIGHTEKAGKYPPNSLGLYDMAGNVSEFCADSWRPDVYAERFRFSKTRVTHFNNQPFDLSKRVIRGGSWNDPAVNLRTTWRESFPAAGCSAYVGFRCAANAVSIIK